MDALVQGLITEVLTPHKPDGSLDAAGLERLVDRAARGADALVLAGPLAGQGMRLSRRRWQLALEAGLAAAPAEMPLLAGLTADDPEEVLARARWLAGRAKGRRLWGLDLPLWYRGNRGLPDWLRRLSRELGAPLVLLSHPELVRGRRAAGRHKGLISSVLAKCAAGGALAGVVHAGPLGRGMAAARALRQAAIPLCDGDEMSFLARPASAGVMSMGAGLLPGQWRLVARHSLGLVAMSPERRGELLAAARDCRELAGLTSARPAQVLAFLAHQAGLIASERTCHRPAGARLLAAAQAWLEERGTL